MRAYFHSNEFRGFATGRNPNGNRQLAAVPIDANNKSAHGGQRYRIYVGRPDAGNGRRKRDSIQGDREQNDSVSGHGLQHQEGIEIADAVVRRRYGVLDEHFVPVRRAGRLPEAGFGERGAQRDI